MDYYLRYNAGSNYIEYLEENYSIQSKCSLYSSVHESEEWLLDDSKESHFPVRQDLERCIADENFSTDVMGLLSEFQRIAVELRKRGVWELIINRMFQPTQMLSRLEIRNNRIFLPDYNDMEIKMTPMAKAVYFQEKYYKTTISSIDGTRIDLKI